MKSTTVEIGKSSRNQGGQQPQKCLDPLAENFDFDSWAKIVKKQMKQKLSYPFSSYLSK